MEQSFSKKIGQRGFGLIEVLIAASIISILALGIATLISDMLTLQKKANTVGVIIRMKENIISSVQNGESWFRTVQDATTATGNPDLTCFRNGADCGDGTTGPLNVKDVAGVEVYYARTANHGFTLQGLPCTAYPSVACPFRWNLTYTLTCPPAVDPCPTPDVRVRGLLEWTADTVSLPGGFNPLLYEIDVRRGSEAIRNDGLSVAYVQTGASGEGSGCEGAGFVQRRLNLVTNDPANNIVNKAGTALTAPLNAIILRPGTYNCRVQAPAFKNGGNRLQLRSIAGTPVPTATSSVATASRNGGSANLSLDTTIVLSVNTTLVVEQKCEFLPSAAGPFWSGSPLPQPANYDTFSLGVPVPIAPGDYTGGTTYTTVSCARTS